MSEGADLLLVAATVTAGALAGAREEGWTRVAFDGAKEELLAWWSTGAGWRSVAALPKEELHWAIATWRERGLLELVVFVGEEEDEGPSELSNGEREELQRLRGERGSSELGGRADGLLAF